MAIRGKKKKLNIDEAVVVKEVHTEISPETKIESSHEVLNDNENLNIHDDSNIDRKKTETIDISKKQESVSEKKVINFEDNDDLDSFIAKKTHKVSDADIKDEFNGKTTDQVRKELDTAEKSSDDWTPEDFYNVAEAIIIIIDTFASNALRIFAKDTSDTAYGLNDRKTKILTNTLAKMLMKYQAKLKVEFLFILALILFYAAPFMAARKRRKAIMEAEATKINETQNTNTVDNTFVDNNIDNSNLNNEIIHDVVSEEVKDNGLVVPDQFKRKRGAPKKQF